MALATAGQSGFVKGLDSSGQPDGGRPMARGERSGSSSTCRTSGACAVGVGDPALTCWVNVFRATGADGKEVEVLKRWWRQRAGLSF
jgi:hypothetical protein